MTRQEVEQLPGILEVPPHPAGKELLDALVGNGDRKVVLWQEFVKGC